MVAIGILILKHQGPFWGDFASLLAGAFARVSKFSDS